MGLLNYDHASDRNPLKALQDALERLSELERASPTGLFRFDSSGTGTSGTIMNPPGRVNLPTSYDFAIENYPVTLGRVVALFAAVPHVIAVWPMSGVRRDSATSQARDMTGAGNHLTNTNASDFGVENYAPFVEFNGSSQNLYKLDGGAANWADVTGGESHVDSAIQGLTLGCWVNFDGLTGSSQYPISKHHPSAGYYGYGIYRDNSRVGGFQVSGTGNAAVSVDMGSDTISDSTWTFMVGRYVPSSTLTLYVSGDWYQTTSSVPAAHVDNASNFMIGAYNKTGATAGYMDGKVSMAFLCAAALTDDQIMALYHQSRGLYGA